MRLEKIRLSGVRNLIDTELQFHPQVNFICGNNGAGKTSILEAIHYLAVGRSFRTSRDSEILKFNAPYLKIDGTAREDNSEVGSIEAEIRYCEGIKTAYLHKQKQEKLSAYLGWLPVVTILLADIELVNGSSDRRRNFIDLAIAKTDKRYLKNLIQYRQVLMQRNKLLCEKAEPIQHEIWEEQLAELGSEIISERSKLIPSLLSDAQKFYAMFIENREIIFEYKTGVDNRDNNLENIRTQLLERLKSTRMQDIELGHTTIGPHRDDIIIKEKNLPDTMIMVRRFGSEGEQRLAALALKMAEAKRLSSRGEAPIFLLDEVASELDLNNTKKLFDLITGQFFYATAKEFKNIINQQGKTFYVEKGEVKKIETAG